MDALRLQQQIPTVRAYGLNNKIKSDARDEKRYVSPAKMVPQAAYVNHVGKNINQYADAYGSLECR
jgi:hypothetical protein